MMMIGMYMSCIRFSIILIGTETCILFWLSGASQQDKGKGKATGEPSAMAQELHDDVKQNLDFYEVAQQELSRKDQLVNRIAELYRILLGNISWYGPKSVPLPKPDFIHGDRIDASINYDFNFILSKYVNETGK